MSDSDPQRPHPGASPTQLRLIRISLLLGVVVTGVIVSVLVQGNPPRAPEMARPLVMVNAAYLVGAMAGILYFQRRHAAEPDRARRITFNVIAWAMGESTALFGAVHYLLIGSPIPFLVGLGMLIASFVLVPIRD
jgi:CHASE2 domain-containing sensor protein